MDAAFAWLSALVEWVGKFFPRWALIDLTEGGIKYESFFLPARLRRYKKSQRVTYCGPGLHWYWPATTVLGVWPMALQTDNLPSQTIETNDNVSITVGGMVTYTVVDLVKLVTQTHSSMKLIQVTTLAAIHAECCKLSWDDLREKQRKRTLNTLLRNAVQRALADYGVKIEDCMLTDLVKTRAYRLIQSTQQDEV